MEPDRSELARQRSSSRPFPNCPFVAAVVTVSDSNLESHAAAIQSVIDQTYRWWQLRLVFGQDQATKIPDYAARFEEDDRIDVTLMPAAERLERGFADALNLDGAEYATVLYPNESLSKSAFWEVARVTNQNPGIDIIYSDEDRLNLRGSRTSPWFKPEWSPDLLLSVDYLHPAFIRVPLIEKVHNPLALLDYATAWEYHLRCTRQAIQIFHIPKVLCHVGSSRSEPSRPPQDAQADDPPRSAEAVGRHLQALGVDGAQAERTGPGNFRVAWSARTALVSIIIPTRDNARWLERCMDSLLKLTERPPFEIGLVDNRSQKSETWQLYERLLGDSRIRLIPFDQPFNFSQANNLGASESQGDLLLFLNDDVEIIDAEWLEELARWAERPEIGVVGAKLLYPDLTIQHAGIILGMGGHAGHVLLGLREGEHGPLGSTEWYRNYMAVTGACMMVPRKVFEQAGGFDERYRIAFGDVDICLRIKERGFRVVYNPFARLLHGEGATRGANIPLSDMQLAFGHFAPYLRSGDPYFSPNLSYRKPYLQLAFKPEDPEAEAERILKRATRREADRPTELN